MKFPLLNPHKLSIHLIPSNHFRSILIAGGLLAILIISTVILDRFVTSRTQFGIDFYVYWQNAQTLFIEGDSPYTVEAALKTQQGLYGRPAQGVEDRKGFVYPLFSLYVLLPTLVMTYSQAIAFWTALNLILLLLTIRFAFPALPLWVMATAPFIYPIARGFLMGQFTVIILTGFIVVYGLLNQDRPRRISQSAFIGFLLAALTIKPQLTWLLIVFILLVGLKRRDWGLEVGFVGGLLILGLSSWVLVPGWPVQLVNYIAYGADELQAWNPLPQIYARWLTPAYAAPIGMIGVGAALLATLFVLWRYWQGKISQLAALTWVVLLTQVIHPLNVPSEQVILILPVLAWINGGNAVKRNRWGHVGVWLTILLLPYIIFFFSYENSLEPMALTTIPPLLFLLWAIALSYAPGNHGRTGHTEQTLCSKDSSISPSQ